MEITEQSIFTKTGIDFEDFDDLPDTNTKSCLESLNIIMPRSRENIGQSVDDMNLKNIPSTSKISMISDTQTTENFMKEFESFYSEMMGKVQGLKTVSALKKTNYKELDNIDDEKLFRHLKNTPDIQEQLEYIKKLDDEIKSVICDYQTEKAERLETQIEMCNEITKNNSLPERDTELFLNLCEFEFANKRIHEKDKEGETSKPDQKPKTSTKKPNDFIMRNVYLAKEGVFANSSLTDEEKVKLEDLLQDQDKDKEHPQRSPFSVPTIQSDISKYLSNAYSLTADEKKKIEDIDSELEKFKIDEKNSEKNIAEKEKPEKPDKPKHSVLFNKNEEIHMLNQVLLEKKIKKLEDRLKKIQEAEEKDLEKLKIIKEKTIKNTDNENAIPEEDELPEIGDLLELNTFDFEDKELVEVSLDKTTEEFNVDEEVVENNDEASSTISYFSSM